MSAEQARMGRLRHLRIRGDGAAVFIGVRDRAPVGDLHQARWAQPQLMDAAYATNNQRRSLARETLIPLVARLLKKHPIAELEQHLRGGRAALRAHPDGRRLSSTIRTSTPAACDATSRLVDGNDDDDPRACRSSSVTSASESACHCPSRANTNTARSWRNDPTPSSAYHRRAALPPAAFAQDDYPGKPIKLIVPFPPAGANRRAPRAPSRSRSRPTTKWTIVVDNTPGRRRQHRGWTPRPESPPDGYTIAMGRDREPRA